MDKDLSELEQLAEGTHADLQDKPKKKSEREVNGLSKVAEQNGDGVKGGVSAEALTVQSSSTAALSEAQTASAKQLSNRAKLQEQQMNSKVNQDLFYQMGPDQDDKEHSPD